MPIPLPIAIAGASAISSLVGDIFAGDEARKNKKRAINAYKRLLIPSADIERRADDVGDTIYTQVMGELNKGAFAYRGSLNPETLRSIAYGKMAGLRAEQELESKRGDEDYNRKIHGVIAEVSAQPEPSFNPADFISAGIQGYIGGTQIEMSQDLLAKQKQFYDILETDLNRGNQSNQNIDWGNVMSGDYYNNPTKKKKKYPEMY